jgi:hypothetical protein
MLKHFIIYKEYYYNDQIKRDEMDRMGIEILHDGSKEFTHNNFCLA